MALTKYRQKRSFDATPEPTGGKAEESGLRFVVQKHAATRLHYDFRLELGGVLKSWAVPKGPSLNPSDKRLAMMVEDHPYDYRNFEGVIPKGNYGAGTVIVWDEGFFEPLDPSGDKATDEKQLNKQLKSGSLKIRVKGHKLKGEFALVKIKNAENNAWLLLKHRDRYAKDTDITSRDKSVLSKKTLEQVAKNPAATYVSNVEGKTAQKATSAKKNAGSKHSASAKTTAVKKSTPTDLKGSPKIAFPKKVEPMLATLVETAPDEPGWLYEIKWDGYRAVALCRNSSVELVSRNQKSFNDKFYPIHEALKQWKINAVVDGEICFIDDNGKANFGALQNWRSEADGNLVYYLFDLLYLDGHDLTALPLNKRRGLLEGILPDSDLIRYSQSFNTTATAFLKVATDMGMEGIMAKKEDCDYAQGARSTEWLKIKANKRHEVVIGGYTKNEGSAKSFSSLLVGVYDGSKLVYTGKIGTGFNQKQQAEFLKSFRPLATKQSPFTVEPDVNKPSRFRQNPPKATVQWLKPELVCEVSYTEMTSDGVMRHPSFEGMRTDKAAKNVKAEKAVPLKKITDKKTAAIKDAVKGSKGNDVKTLLNPSETTQVKKLRGHSLKFTNLDKVYWPADNVSKREMLNYYYQAASYILPYLINRPQSLNRYPNGIKGKSFYQKDVTGKVPEWIQQFPYHTNEGEDKNFMVPQNEADLLYMANLGAIEMNPWNSTIDEPDHPTWCLIDLDPDTGNSFDQVIQTAQTVKSVLDELGVKGYAKTSGSTGIHIYIPLGAKYTYDECQLFGKLIAAQTQQQLPRFTSIERMTKNRKGKIYIDYLQNRPKATLAAPYSLRPKPGAPVSMPLHWEEVKKGLKITDFNIQNAIKRIKSEGDIFKPVLGKGINLKTVLNKLEKMSDE